MSHITVKMYDKNDQIYLPQLAPLQAATVAQLIRIILGEECLDNASIGKYSVTPREARAKRFSMKFLKRYPDFVQSACLDCGKFLCVMAKAATYSGDVECTCGAVNTFRNSSTPVEADRQIESGS